MRLITPEEHGNGMKCCSFCKPEKTDAVWRSERRHLLGKPLQLACPEHQGNIEDGPALQPSAPNNTSDDHLSEADHQTWMRL